MRGPSRLSAICEVLRRDRKVALTTVATMLKIMKGKGQVRRRLSKDGVVWEAKLSHADAGSSMLATLVNDLFDGSAQKLVLHLIERDQLSEADRRQIQALLDRRQNN
jgi:predicted transcriptional regulator